MVDMQREKNLDYLKGLCILFVIITHYAWTKEEMLKLGFPFTIDMAVPFFMLVTGYVYAMSYNKKGIDTLDKAFTFKRLFEQFIRFTVPFLIAFFVECVIYLALAIIGHPIMSVKDYVMAALTGGWGPGSYYYPVMIQFIFIYPFIYMLIKKYNTRALFILFLVNVFWEIIKIPYEVTEGGYRLLVFRYIFLIAFGCYVFFNYRKTSEKLPKRYILYAMISILFIIMTKYLGYKTCIFDIWAGTCVIACLWILPIFKWIASKTKWNMKLPLDILGKCSYEIFLVQMVYYNFVQGYESLFGNVGIFLAVTIVVCVFSGWLFNRIDELLIKKIKDVVLKRVERQKYNALSIVLQDKNCIKQFKK